MDAPKKYQMNISNTVCSTVYRLIKNLEIEGPEVD